MTIMLVPLTFVKPRWGKKNKGPLDAGQKVPTHAKHKGSPHEDTSKSTKAEGVHGKHAPSYNSCGLYFKSRFLTASIQTQPRFFNQLIPSDRPSNK